MIPSIEELVTTYLVARDDVNAAIVGRTPDSVSEPWVKVTSLDPKPITPNADEHFLNFMVQFDCYAGEAVGRDLGQETADLLTRSVRFALKEMRLASHTGAVVTDVDFTSCPRIPDLDFEPPMERYALTAEIYAHS